MKRILIAISMLFALFLLSGCFGTVNSTMDLIGSNGAEASDSMLKASEWGVCQAVTVGALRRRYSAGSGNAAAGWQLYCNEVWDNAGEKPVEVFEKTD